MRINEQESLSDRLRNGSMADAAEQEASEGDVDHSFGEVEALLLVAHEATPTREPAEGAPDDPAPRQHLEAGLGVDAADNLDDEVEERGLVHELGPVRRRRRTDA